MYSILAKTKTLIADGLSAVANIIMITAMICCLSLVALADLIDNEDRERELPAWNMNTPSSWSSNARRLFPMKWR